MTYKCNKCMIKDPCFLTFKQLGEYKIQYCPFDNRIEPEWKLLKKNKIKKEEI